MTTLTFDDTRTIPNSAEYQRLHRWVREQLGKADKCSMDEMHQSTRYDWSNISKKYLAELSDWQMLCRACHRAYDPITPEGRKRLSEIKKIQSRGNTSHNTPVVAIADGKIAHRFDSVKEASEFVGRGHSAISLALNGRTKKCAGYQWRYERGL